MPTAQHQEQFAATRERILKYRAKVGFQIIANAQDLDIGSLYREQEVRRAIYKDINRYYDEKAYESLHVQNDR